MGSDDERAAAFGRIYDAHYAAIAAYARRRLDPLDAEDLVAETFLVTWRRLADVPAGNEALPWLYGVARRILSQRRRGARRWDRLVTRIASLRRPEDEIAMPPEDPDGRDAVLGALAGLRPQDQELLRLAEWEELGHAELASVLGCSTNAVAIRLHRAHRRFRQALEAAPEDIVGATEPKGPR
jgi:RNA polymerase sigma factor (sigma-70 family)